MGRSSRGRGPKGRSHRNGKPSGTDSPGGGRLLFFGGYHTFLFGDYFRVLGPLLETLREEPTRKRLETFFTLLRNDGEYTSLESVNLLVILRDSLERQIGEIVSQHSSYYWLHLYRRLAPANTFNHESLVSVGLYRHTMEAAFAKYGCPQANDEFVSGSGIEPSAVMDGEVARVHAQQGSPFVPDPGHYVKHFGAPAFVSLLALERLVAEFCHAVASLRRAYKGGKLVIFGEWRYEVKNDEQVEALIVHYDRRAEAYPAFVTAQGIPMRAIGDHPERGGRCIVPVYNLARLDCTALPLDALLGFKIANQEFSPNFAPLPVDLREYVRRHAFLEDSFEAQYGISIPAVVNCIASLAWIPWFQSMDGETQSMVQLLQRGYHVYRDWDSLADHAAWSMSRLAEMGMLPVPDGSEAESPTILKALIILGQSEDERTSIDLSTRGPRPLVHSISEVGIVVDFAAIPELLADLPHRIDGANWSAKGPSFEDYVVDLFRSRGIAVWQHQRVLRSADGTKREVDVAFIHDRVLFVCDCRAIARSRAFERGESQALAYRRSKLVRKLDQVESLANWIADHPIGRNYEVPDGVGAVLPLVISPFVEYLWSQDPYWWLTTNVPRICVAPELADGLSSYGLAEALQAPFIRTVHR